jgi:hypothetical protein
MKLHQTRAALDQVPPGTRHEPCEAEIQKAAYYLWQEKGCPDGHDLDNWLEARELLRHHTPVQKESHTGSKRQSATAPAVLHFPTPHSTAPFPTVTDAGDSSHLDFRHGTPPSQPSNPPLRKS